MNRAYITSSLMPVSAVRQEVRARYNKLNLSLPYAQLRDHVTAKLARPSTSPCAVKKRAQHTCTSNTRLAIPDAKQATSRTHRGDPVVPASAGSSKMLETNSILTMPTFFELHVQSTKPRKTRKEKAEAARLSALLEALEQALTYCALASAPTPKPLRAMLDDAMAACQRYDELEDQHKRADDMMRCHRVSGGKARHKDFRLLQRLAIRLLCTATPTDLWKSKASAAKVLGKHLAGVAIKHKLKASTSPDTWAHNVMKLMRTNAKAAEAYRRHSRQGTSVDSRRSAKDTAGTMNSAGTMCGRSPTSSSIHAIGLGSVPWTCDSAACTSGTRTALVGVM